ncbi:MAG: MarR family transcriptional regulator [Candidatus Methanomethyliaceae archaeon]|nr:MarR family transcriptional regulator [Candidatus Methanomethyliaceae archaeon]MDW7970895.1 MarR family transcriptional regulator [Nitrososphaerota archaeon]
MSESLVDKVLSMLQNSGELIQSRLPKLLGVDAKTISKTLKLLERNGVIRREKFVDEGKITYKIYLVKREQGIELNDISWAPCTTCPNLERCGRGQPISPESCEKLTIAIKIEHQKLLSSGGINSAK